MALIPVLALVLIFLLKNPLTASSAAQAQSMPQDPVAVTQHSDVIVRWEVPPRYEPVGRDPMRWPTAVAEPGEDAVAGPRQIPVDLAVTGILYSADRPMAIVDTKLVREGQQVSGAHVRKIEADGIEFEMNGRVWKQTVERE